MNQSATPTIRRATEADIDEIVRVVAAAFATDDPIEEYVFPDAAIRERRTPGMLRTMIRHRFLPGDGAIVATLDDRVVGAMLWYPAGYRKSLWREMVSGPQLLWAMGPATVRGIHVDEAIARVAPAEPHHLLVYLGIDPDIQRSGVGRALVDWVDAQADRESAPVCGITKDDNVAYYRRFGFEFVTKARIGKTGPELNFVLRPPVPVRTD
ncbi:GNAT family N-acetyltransferase [Nocardia otitidiscaviarum]|uniref:GNAT family N-acetyltransferase n=1 Tax=Nocardia otitidiscaviarum TaxID=1823 RepID=UPI0004A74E02|nr:GNAT family N-acetyltransferase [Nocardia otitidiscaviarum]